MKKSILFFATFLMFHYFINAQSDPDWNWESKLEATSNSNLGKLDIKDITVSYDDPHGQVDPYIYVTGKFSGTITVNGNTLTNAGIGSGGYNADYDGFLAQFDIYGNLQWITGFGSGIPNATWEEAGMSVTADWRGNVYVTGYIRPDNSTGVLSVTLGDNLLTPSGSSSPTGITKTTTNTNVNNTSTVPFVAKFDNSGTIQWLDIIEAPAGRGLSVALSTSNDGTGLSSPSNDGDLYVTGYFANHITYQNCSGACRTPGGTPNANTKTFIAKYKTLNGNTAWTNYINNDPLDISSFNVGRGLAIEGDFIDPFSQQRTANQDVYLVGEYKIKATLDHTTTTTRNLPTPIQIDGYIAKLDHTNGLFIWEQTVSSSGDDFVKEADMFANRSELYIIGDYEGATTLTLSGPGGNNITTSGSGGGDVFVARYDWNGHGIWATTLASPDADYGTDIIVFKENNDDLHIAGIYGDQMTDAWGQTLLRKGTGGADHFIAKLDRNNGYTFWADGIDASWDDLTNSTDYFYSRPRIAYELSRTDNVYMSGLFKGSERPIFTNQLGTAQTYASYIAERRNCNCPEVENFSVNRFGVSLEFAQVTWIDPPFAACNANYFIQYTEQVVPPAPMQDGPYAFGSTNTSNVINLNPAGNTYEFVMISDCSYGQSSSGPVFQKNGANKKSKSKAILVEGLAKDEKVEVYPNPVTNSLFISGEFTKGTDGLQSVEVMDILGKVVKKEAIEGSTIKNYQLELGGLKTGIYIVKIKSTNHTHSFKVTKE